MKITVRTGVHPRDEFRRLLEISANGKELSFRDGEPEDSNLSRDFRDCHRIGEFMRMAWEAGRAGEPFEIEEIEEWT